MRVVSEVASGGGGVEGAKQIPDGEEGDCTGGKAAVDGVCAGSRTGVAVALTIAVVRIAAAPAWMMMRMMTRLEPAVPEMGACLWAR